MEIDPSKKSIEHILAVEHIAKKYSQQKLFKDINFSIQTGDVLAVTGPNGSGKSTLLKIIAGLIAPQKGTVKLFEEGKLIAKEQYFKKINISAPYLELIEEFTLAEHIKFHNKFKPQLKEVNLQSILEESGLNKSLNKPVANFSSGMKQRLKLILALCFEGHLVLLDEPTSHLDKEGKIWYRRLMDNLLSDRICIIFSNDEEEYTDFKNNLLNIEPIN